MALKVGDLYVSLAANTEQFGRGMKKAIGEVEKFASKIDNLGKKAAQLGAMMMAPAVAAAALASNYDREVSGAMENVQNAFGAAAVEIAKSLLPAMKELADTIGRVAAWIRDLDPGLKAQVVHWGKITVAVLGVIAAAGQFAGVVSMVAKFGLVLLPVALPLLAIAAGLAGVILLAGALKIAWDANIGGVQEITHTVADGVGRAFSWMGEQAMKALNFIREMVVANLNAVAALLRAMSGLPGIGGSLKKLGDMAADAAKALGKEWTVEGAKGLISDAIAVGKDAGAGMADGLKSSFSAGMEALGLDKLVGKVSGFLSLPDQGVRAQTIADQDAGASAKAEAWKKIEDEMLSNYAAYLQNVAKDEEAAAEAARRAAEDTARLEKRAAEDAARALQALKARADAAFEGLKGKFVGRTGDVGSVVESGVQGAQAGGAVGAVVGVVVDLITRSETFMAVVQDLGGLVAMLADALGSFLSPLRPLVAVLKMLVGAFTATLQPIFSLMGKVIESLIPPLLAVTHVFAALAPLLSGVLLAAFTAVSYGMLLLLPVMQVLFGAIKYVGIGILYAAKAISGVWSGIIGALQSVLQSIASIEVLGAHPFSFLGDLANSLEGARLNSNVLQAQIDNLEKLGWESAIAGANAAVPDDLPNDLDTLGDAVNAATEAFTNVPSGYKTALAQFNATNPDQVIGVGVVGTATPLGAPVFTGPITIVANDPETFMAELERRQQRNRFVDFGTLGRPSRVRK